MNKLTQILISIAIIVLLGFGLFFAGYKTAQKTFSSMSNISNYDTVKVVYDTLKIRDTILNPVPYAVIDTIKIPTIVDTNAIILDYYKERQYLFSYPFGTVSFSVFNNNLFDYAANFNVISQRVFLRPKQLYGIGGAVGIIVDKPYIQINGSYVNRNNMFTIGVSYPFGLTFGYQYLFYKY